MKLNERNIFLLDGVGAALSAITIGLVLPQFPDWVGLSKGRLYLLGLLASIYAVYSLTCFWFVRRPKASMLLGIISANSAYCVLTLSITLLSSELTVLGRAYFIIEIAIIAGVVFLETRVYRKSFGPFGQSKHN